MAAKNLGTKNQEIVDAVLPKGQVIQMPDDLAENLALRTPRRESPSSIRTYLGCPLRWYFSRYAPVEGEVEPPGYHGVIGSFVHRVLEVFFSEPKEERTEELLDRIFRSATDVIKQGNTKVGLIDPGLQSEFEYVIETAPKPREEGGWGFPGMTTDRVIGSFFKRSSECIENAKDFYPDANEENVVSTENWGTLDIDNSNGQTTSIRMKIDKIVDDPRGISIVDYKTGKAPDEDNEDGMECLRDENGEPVLDDLGNRILLLADSYIAMGIYALALYKGGVQGVPPEMPANVQLHYLKDNIKYSARVRPSHLKMVEDVVRRVTDDMLKVSETREIIATPYVNEDGEPDGGCFFCPIKNVCPAMNNGDWSELRKEYEF